MNERTERRIVQFTEAILALEKAVRMGVKDREYA